jgi:hypothetical protein
MMSTEQTQTEQQADTLTRQDLLCRVVDVEFSLLAAFKRFVEEEKSSLEDMMQLAREELSKMELFAPKVTDDTAEEIKLEIA